MTWRSLGIIKPGLDWQLYDIPVVGTETFKVSNTWTIAPFYRMSAYLGQFFGSINEVVVHRRIYPIKAKEQILDLPIPKNFREAGITTLYMGIKLVSTTYPGLYSYDWRVEISEYY